jgi:hypothetical protein
MEYVPHNKSTSAPPASQTTSSQPASVDVLDSVIIKRDTSNASHQVEEDKFVTNLDTTATKTFSNVGIKTLDDTLPTRNINSNSVIKKSKTLVSRSKK